MSETLRQMLIRLHSMGYQLGRLDGHNRPDAAALDLIQRIEQFVEDVEVVTRIGASHTTTGAEHA